MGILGFEYLCSGFLRVFLVFCFFVLVVFVWFCRFLRVLCSVVCLIECFIFVCWVLFVLTFLCFAVLAAFLSAASVLKSGCSSVVLALSRVFKVRILNLSYVCVCRSMGELRQRYSFLNGK